MADVFKKTVDILLKKKLTVTFAESCTGGLLCKSITDIPGASAVFHGGAVTYSNDIKTSVIGVSQKTIDEVTEVSDQCACEMAEGVRRMFRADIGASATGYAGPGGGTDINPVGTVFVGVSVRGRTSAYRLYYPDKTRAEIRELVTSFVAYITACEADKL